MTSAPARNGGELGAFGHGQMVPEFEKAAFEAKVGRGPPVVSTQFGYHIIKVEAHDSTPFEQVKATLEKNARAEEAAGSARRDEDRREADVQRGVLRPPPPAAPLQPRGSRRRRPEHRAKPATTKKP